MRAISLLATVAVVAGASFGAARAQDDCAFEPWRTFKGTQLHRHAASGAYYFTTAHKAVDADGAPNAYHPDDVGKNCRSDPHIGLDCPANAGFPNADWWDSVLVADPSDPTRPFRQTSGAFAGFFVAMTWLTDPAKAKTDVAKYVDSRTVPYMVMPGNEFPSLSGTGFKGDIGLAWNAARGTRTALIIADRGGGADAELGEASIALFTRLGYSDPNPRTGAGLDSQAIRYLVFPGSRRATDPDWPQDVDAIERRAQALFDALGGDAAFAGCP
jgi:hypothetical protein